MNIPNIVYRGARGEQLDTLTPQLIPEGDRERYGGKKSVVFASPYKTEAMIYAVFSQRNEGSFSITPEIIEGRSISEIDTTEQIESKIRWKVSVPYSRDKLPLDEKVNIYELPGGKFEWAEGSGELYSEGAVEPISVETMTVRDVLEGSEGKIIFMFKEDREGELPIS